MDDSISRSAVIDALDAICERECEYSKPQRAVMCGACRLGSAFDVMDELPSAQHTCETCCYWGNRMILRDGSLGDCGNFEKNLSKDFYCAWWSQKGTVERGEEDD